MSEETNDYQPLDNVVESSPVDVKCNRQKGWKVATVLLALVAVGLGVYLALDKTVLKDSAGKTGGEAKECVAAGVEGDAKEIATGGNGYVYRPEYHGVFYVTKEGDVYYQPAKSFYDGVENVALTIKDAGNIGTKGKYTLKYDDFETWYEMSDNDGTFTFDGYKLDLSNIVIVTEAQYGHQKVAATTIFIDKEGNLSTLVSTNLFTKDGITYKLYKNIESNVRSVSRTIGGNEVTTVIHYMDGSTKEADYKKLHFTDD